MSALGSLAVQRGTAGARLVGRGPVWVGSVTGVGPLPLLALPVRCMRLPPLLLSLVSVMLHPPAGHPGAGGGSSKSDRSASDRDRSPQPGPFGLGSGSRSATGADRSRSGYGCRSSPASSGVAEDDHASTFD